MLNSGDRQAVLLRLHDELSESQELIKRNLSTIRKSVRKMIRKFDIFKPMDVVRPLCVSDDNGEFRFQLRLTRNSDLIFASEDLSTKGLWTEVPFLTIFVERQSPEILEHSQNEPDRLSEPKNVGGDAAAKLVELSTRLEKVEILLGSAMLRSTTKGSSNASSPFPKEVVPASDNLKQTPVESRVSMTPQAASNFVTTATSPHSPPPTCTPRKVASSVSSKLKATSDKTPVSKSVQAATVSSHCPPVRNSVPQKMISSATPKKQSLVQMAIAKANPPQKNPKQPLVTTNNINTLSEPPSFRRPIPQSGVSGGPEYVWQTPAPYLANLDEIIESVVAGLDDPNDFTIEPPSRQTAFNSTVCTTTIDFDEYVRSLCTEASKHLKFLFSQMSSVFIIAIFMIAASVCTHVGRPLAYHHSVYDHYIFMNAYLFDVICL
ncbi:hypothetical protein ECG_08483 [Echinococcus granulosus]|nr:hypothetical protein ECG_08483 [Echinococcus granulosus]